MQMRFFGFLKVFALFAILGLVVGCSVNADNKKADNKKVKKTLVLKPYATDVQGIFEEGPGIYAGSRYNQAKVNQALEEIPGNLSGEKAYQYLVNFFAEDYRTVVKKLDNYNSLVWVDGVGKELSAGQKEKKITSHLSVRKGQKNDQLPAPLAKIQQQLKGITFDGGLIDRLTLVETKHMRDALDQLAQMGKISFEEEIKVENLIIDRENMLYQYRINRYLALYYKIEERVYGKQVGGKNKQIAKTPNQMNGDQMNENQVNAN
jgi:hypothetical protein